MKNNKDFVIKVPKNKSFWIPTAIILFLIFVTLGRFIDSSSSANTNEVLLPLTPTSFILPSVTNTPSPTPTPIPTNNVPKVIYQPITPTANPALVTRLNEINSRLTYLQSAINGHRNEISQLSKIYDDGQISCANGGNCVNSALIVSTMRTISNQIDQAQAEMNQLNAEKTQILLKQ